MSYNFALTKMANIYRHALKCASAVGAASSIYIDRLGHCNNQRSDVYANVTGTFENSVVSSWVHWGRGRTIENQASTLFEGRKIKQFSFGTTHSAAICEKGEKISIPLSASTDFFFLSCEENLWFWPVDGSPEKITSSYSFCGVAVGKNRSFGLTREGNIYFWSNDKTTKIEQLNTRRGWFSFEKVVQITANGENLACVTNTGKVLTLGRGNCGQLGNGKVDFYSLIMVISNV